MRLRPALASLLLAGSGAVQDEDVRRLEVAVHDAVRMKVGDRRDDLRGEPLRTALCEAVEFAELLEEVATWLG